MLEKIKHHQKKAFGYAAHLRDMRVLGLLAFLVILLLVSWSGVKTIEANYGLQKQISALRQENGVKKLTNENLKLENDYYKTSQYLDISARQDFGLAAPGEVVLNVPRSVALSYTVDLPKPVVAQDDQPQGKQPAFQRNFQSWMDFLLHRNQDN